VSWLDTDAPVGSSGEFEVFLDSDHSRRVGLELRGPRTVVRFEVRDLDVITVPDVVVPVPKPAP
jgi:hypothetical protein